MYSSILKTSRFRTKSHRRAISDLFWTNLTWNRPVTKYLSQSYSRTWEQNLWTKHHAMLCATCDWRSWAGISSITKHVTAWQRIDPSWWILWKFVREKLVARAGIETLLQITCQSRFRIKTPSVLFSRICLNLACCRGSWRHLWSLSRSATKFCPLVNKPVALGFSLWWRIFDIS